MYFKYRSLDSFQNLVDIFLRKRLYAAPYTDLNDPMEGQYLLSPSGSIDDDMATMLTSVKDSYRICSLSESPNNDLMWAHYANGNRGLAIGLDIEDSFCEVRPIKYGNLMTLHQQNFGVNTPIEVLSCKLKAWQYEKEVRAFVKNRRYVGVRLRKVILGTRMSNQDKGMIQDLCSALCPEANVVSAPRRPT